MKGLLYCGGMPCYYGKNTVTKKSKCNNGDSMLWAGLLYSVNPTEEMKQGFLNSIGTDGMPWRSPEHKGKDPIDTFSRDMYLGLLLYVLTSKDIHTLQNVMGFVAKNKYKTAKNDSDERSFLTPAMIYLTAHVYHYVTGKKHPLAPNALERFLDLKTLEISAGRNKAGYELHLVSVNLYIRLLCGVHTQSHADIAGIIYSKEPENIWYEYLYHALRDIEPNKGRMYATLEEYILDWKPCTKTSRWLWQDMKTKHQHMGHDLLFMKGLLDAKD